MYSKRKNKSNYATYPHCGNRHSKIQVRCSWKDGRGKILGKSLTIMNTKEGFDIFFACMEEMQHKHEEADVLVDMEPPVITG